MWGWQVVSGWDWGLSHGGGHLKQSDLCLISLKMDSQWLFKKILIIHKRHTESCRDISRGRSRLPVGNLMQDSFSGPQGHALSQRQPLNHWATKVPLPAVVRLSEWVANWKAGCTFLDIGAIKSRMLMFTGRCISFLVIKSLGKINEVWWIQNACKSTWVFIKAYFHWVVLDRGVILFHCRGLHMS